MFAGVSIVVVSKCHLRILDLILEHFLKGLLKMSSYELRKTNPKKDPHLIHERVEMCSYTAKVFLAVLPRMRNATDS